jgi:hypothetical protein
MYKKLSQVFEDHGCRDSPKIIGRYNLAKFIVTEFTFTFEEFVCWLTLSKPSDTLREYIENMRINNAIL